MYKTHWLQFIQGIRLYFKTAYCTITKDEKCVISNDIKPAIDAQIRQICESRKSSCKIYTWNSINSQVLESREMSNERVRIGFGVFPEVIVKK